MTKNKIVQNASWIIIGKIGQSLLGLIVTMLTARFLGPSNYGIISYAASIVTFLVPIMQLGLNEIMVQEIVEAPDEAGKIIGTSIFMNFISAIACMICVFIFVSFVNHGEKDTIIVCCLYSILLLFQSVDLIRYWFQAKYLAKYISIICLISYAIASAYKIFLLVTGKSIYWFAVSNAIDYLFVAVFSVCVIKKIGHVKFKFSRQLAIKLFNKSKYYIISGLMVNVFAQTDKIMLKIYIDDTITGYYTAAVTCAAMTSFVFIAIIDSLRPLIFKSKNSCQEKYENYIVLLYTIVIYLSLAQSLFMTVFSPLIIKVLYGESYQPAVQVLRLIVWYTTFSYMGPVRNIWILVEGKQKYIWQINLSGALLNIIMNACLIPIWGAMGAALASLITQIFTNVVVGYIIRPISYNNSLMVRGLNPNQLFQYIKRRT